jgi:hypothetical protein
VRRWVTVVSAVALTAAPWIVVADPALALPPTNVWIEGGVLRVTPLAALWTGGSPGERGGALREPPGHAGRLCGLCGLCGFVSVGITCGRVGSGRRARG